MNEAISIINTVFDFVLTLIKQIFSFAEPKMTTAIYGGTREEETVTCEHYWICETESHTHGFN